MKIRGYRIELSEIEAVLLDLPQIAQAAVTTFEDEGAVELVAYYALKQDADLPRNEISQALRSKLPSYMVPAFLEELPSIPMTLSNKADHKRLPKPQLARFSTAHGYVAAEDRERAHPARRFGRGPARRPRLDRASFLRRPRRQLAADGARLRGDPQEPADVERVDARHLHQSDDRQRSRIIWIRRSRASSPTQPEPFHVPSNLAYYHLRRAAARVLRRLSAARPVDARYRLSMGHRVRRRIRALRAQRRVRRRIVRRADRALDRRQVGADRALQDAVDPDLEPGVFPLLGRQDADADIARRWRSPARRSTTPTCA